MGIWKNLIDQAEAQERRRALMGCCFLIALLARVAASSYLGWAAPVSEWGDDPSYLKHARQCVDSEPYSNLWFPPGYILILALLTALFDDWVVVAARGLQVLLGATTSLLLFDTTRRLSSQIPACIVALIFAVYPGHLYMGWRIMAEVVFSFTLMLAVWIFVAFYGDARRAPYLGLGAVLGIACITKSNLLPWPLLIGLGLVIEGFRGARPRAQGVCVLLAFGLVYTAVPISNWLGGGHAHPLPGNAGATLRMGNHEEAGGYNMNLPGHLLLSESVDKEPLGRDLEYFRSGLSSILTRPWHFGSRMLKKIANAYGPFPQARSLASSRMGRWLYALTWTPLLPWIWLGLFRKDVWAPRVSILYWALGVHLLMVVLFSGSPRFTLHILPICLVLVGLGLSPRGPKPAGPC